MKGVTIGGERLGSGAKNIASRRHFERSTHDLSFKWRSSMACGTLVPFMNEVCLIGDSWDIDLFTEVVTLPTLGPLFGSFKVQLDVFYIPARLYIASLHMNRLGIGNNMADVPLPLMEVRAVRDSVFNDGIQDNRQINPSSLLKYLGLSGIGRMLPAQVANVGARNFNALGLIGYWDTIKNYYANKQESDAYGIHTSDATLSANQAVEFAHGYQNNVFGGEILTNPISFTVDSTFKVVYGFGPQAREPNPADTFIKIAGASEPLTSNFGNFVWDDVNKTYSAEWTSASVGSQTAEVAAQSPDPLDFDPSELVPSVTNFPLDNIDQLRLDILQHTPQTTAFQIDHTSPAPFSWPFEQLTFNSEAYIATEFSQEGLGLKTYQSDLFQNWIDTEWIDGVNGVNAVTAVDTTGNSFTIDALNLAHKVYAMLNRVALSGGTYDDWKEAVYDHYGRRSVENPVYMGSLIKELAFEEVISTANADSGQVSQALGTLAGRGRLTNKHKGGKIRVKCDDIGYIMGIVSLTPRIEYSQGNKWDLGLLNMDDFHKPDLDRIGYQDLMTGQLAWQNIQYNGDTSTVVSEPSAGKQPAWLNYMTNVDRCFGNFADRDKEMFMVLNRRYDIDPNTGLISDLTTYIDPTHYNQIFADTNIDAQNFWVHIGAKISCRRKMSAKVIPNL